MATEERDAKVLLTEASDLTNHDEPQDSVIMADEKDKRSQDPPPMQSSTNGTILPLTEQSNLDVSVFGDQQECQDAECLTDGLDLPSAAQAQPSYLPPIEDPYDKAMKYLSKHNIFELFQTITADIVYKRPHQPLQFMIDEIEKLQEQDRYRKGVFLKLNTEKEKSSPNGAKKPDQGAVS